MKVDAIVTRCGGWWAVEVPAIPGLFTQARRLDQVEDMVQDAAGMLGVEVDNVNLIPDVGDVEAAALLEGANARRAELREVEDAAAAASRAAVARLRANGLPVRDVATLMGISPQRVSQLASA